MAFRRPPDGKKKQSKKTAILAAGWSIPWLAKLMTAIAFDTLKFAKRLKEAGFTEQQAEALAIAEAELIADNLATKRDVKELEVAVQRDVKELETALRHDIKELETALRHDIKELEVALRRDIKELETKIEQIRAALKRDIEELRADLKRDIEELRTDLKRDIKELETRVFREMKDLEYRMTIKLGTLLVVAVGAMATLAKLL